jgi:hypothetical protein
MTLNSNRPITLPPHYCPTAPAAVASAGGTARAVAPRATPTRVLPPGLGGLKPCRPLSPPRQRGQVLPPLGRAVAPAVGINLRLTSTLKGILKRQNVLWLHEQHNFWYSIIAISNNALHLQNASSKGMRSEQGGVVGGGGLGG